MKNFRRIGLAASPKSWIGVKENTKAGILTNYVANINSEIEVLATYPTSYKLKQEGEKGRSALFFNGISCSINTYNNTIGFWYGSKVFDNVPFSAKGGDLLHVIVDRKRVVVNGTQLLSFDNITNVSTDLPMSILYRYLVGLDDYLYYGRLYFFVIKEQLNIVRYFVPVSHKGRYDN